MQNFNEKISLNSDSPQERRGFLKKLAGLAVATTAMGGFTNLLAKKPGTRSELTAAFGSEDYLCSIAMFGGNFAPRNWALCNGQLLSIAQYSAVFSILGTTFGGDGRTTFGLPDLRGRVPVHAGQGPGLTLRTLGEARGAETVTLISSQMPAHNHGATLTAPGYTGAVTPKALTGRGSKTNVPTGAFMTTAPDGTNIYASSSDGVMGSSDVTITQSTPGSVAILNAGSSQPHENMQPYLCVNFIICLYGLFPTRD